MNNKLNSTLLAFLLLAIAFSTYSCKNSNQKADAIYYNGTVYTVDSSFSIVEAFAVKAGKIIATGTNEEIQKFESNNRIDLKGKFVYPGFIDAHSHFYGYSSDLLKCNLYGTKSFDEIIDLVNTFAKTNKFSWLLGRGWDQNDWKENHFPNKTVLDSLFPETPVYLMRVDGHAVLVNQKALDISGINIKTKIAGGEIEIVDGKLTGILIDNAVDSVKKFIPDFSQQLINESLLKGQRNCFEVGLTSVTDAGLDRDTIEQLDALQKSDQVKIRINAMIIYGEGNCKYYFKKGKSKTDRLNVSSFKIYADGALGSRGACLTEPYADEHGHYGMLLQNIEYFKLAAQQVYDHNFQLCIHAIGDSANRLILSIYSDVLKTKNDRRWRIEHCQVVDSNDLAKFGKYSIIPSVQPTHATSDMYWAEDRLGSKRINNAYSYKQLLQQNKMLAYGTDFPVEDINPLFGFYAFVVRKDQKGFPENGFQTSNSLTREEALKAMTIWAAYSAFEEKEKGSLEKGKFADFVIMEKDMMKSDTQNLFNLKVFSTFLNGEMVFSRK